MDRGSGFEAYKLRQEGMDYVEFRYDPGELAICRYDREPADLIQIKQIYCIAEACFGRSRDDVNFHQLEDLHNCDPDLLLLVAEPADYSIWSGRIPLSRRAILQRLGRTDTPYDSPTQMIDQAAKLR